MNKKKLTAYTGVNQEIITMIPKDAESVLDVGCARGALLDAISKSNDKNIFTVGIEVNKKFVSEAKKKIDKVELANFETYDVAKLRKKFDVIIFGDVLEHFKKPPEAIKKAKTILKKNGLIIASIPNIRHYHAFVEIFIKGIFPREQRGIFDNTHLRFFTLKNIKNLFRSNGFEITKIKRKYRFIEKPSNLNNYAKILGIPIIKEFFVFQYVIKAKIIKHT